MATSPPKAIMIAKPTGGAKPAGVLTIQPKAKAKEPKAKSSSGAQNSARSKAPASRLKVIVRRLPPGLTGQEFSACLGDDWKTGGERVDWASFVAGKVSKNPANPSRPSRAYLHLKGEELLTTLAEKVKATQFLDAAGTHADPALLGPPTLEFSPFNRVPLGVPRKDARQGTIDQDQDFIDFLQELTSPISKPAPVEAAGDKEPKENAVTPLVQFLREKKANKAKEAAAKAAKARQDAKDAGASDKKASKKDKADRKDKKGEKAKEPVKILNKPAKASQDESAKTAQQSAAAASKPEKKRERGSAAAAAKILQRDLGLDGGSSRRRRREANGAAKTPQNKTDSPASAAKTADGAAPPTGPADPAAKAAEPSAAKSSAANAKAEETEAPGDKAKPAKAQGKPASAKASQKHQKAASTPAAVTPTAVQAFLKHANPSQGVTEALLESTFAEHGGVTRVEIDKKKGFAYIDFSAPEGLQKAIAASPVKVAQAQVVVLERKTGPSLQGRNAKGGQQANGEGASAANRPPRHRNRGRGGRAPADAQTSKSNGTAAPAPAQEASKPSAAAPP